MNYAQKNKCIQSWNLDNYDMDCVSDGRRRPNDLISAKMSAELAPNYSAQYLANSGISVWVNDILVVYIVI